MSRVLEYAKSVPWAIQPEALETVLAIASRELSDPEAIERAAGREVDGAQRMRIRNEVAVISLRGPMFRYANLFTRMSGATSTELLAQDVGAALADPGVRGIILDIDSPGGMVNGTSELAELIYSARGEKPIWSFISGAGASGAYWAASAAERVFAERSSMIGSIGAVIGITDFRQADEKKGVRTMEFVSAQSPKKRMDPFDEDPDRAQDARAEIQRLVDDIAAVFVSDVARNRGVSVEGVLSDFGQGGVLIGEAARTAGMVDGITTMEALISDITQDRRSRGIAGFRPAAAGAISPRSPTDNQELHMSDTEKTAAAQSPVIDRAYLDANHPDVVASIEARGAETERVRITAIQALAGPEDVKAEAIKAGASAGDAALQILAAQKAADAARAKAHLSDRAAAEGATEKPGPDVDGVGASDDQSRAKQVVALHNRLKGRDSASAA